MIQQPDVDNLSVRPGHCLFEFEDVETSFEPQSRILSEQELLGCHGS